MKKIGYCQKAMLYDEQPVTFEQSFKQRLRWAKGFFQVFHRYGLDLFKGTFERRNMSCYDMLMVIMPAIILTIFTLIFNEVFCYLVNIVTIKRI